jgi:hypothetical protein
MTPEFPEVSIISVALDLGFLPFSRAGLTIEEVSGNMKGSSPELTVLPSR